MEKRFTSKDIVLISIVSLVALLVLLSMYQIDRQWSRLSEMERILAEQAQEMRTLRSTSQLIERRLRGGVTFSGNQAAGLGDDIPAGLQNSYEMTQKEDYAQGDSLILPLSGDIDTLTALVSTTGDAGSVQSYVLEGLATMNNDTLDLEGLIARTWEVSEDGLVVTFDLRDDVTFSDGVPLTADDVAFTYDFIFDDRIAAPHMRAHYEKIEAVTALSDYQVAFRFKEPYYNSLRLAATFQVLARHFYEPYLENPEQYNESRGILFGSGPYRLSDPRGWTPDQGGVELERNPRYWPPVQPSYDKIVWRVISNDAARLTTFRNGEIDVYGAQPREYQQLLDDEGLAQRTKNFEYIGPLTSYSFIGWNQERNDQPTRFSDRRVRQAMSYLTDLQKIIDEIWLGYGEPAISPFNPRGPQHDPSVEPYPYDPDRARDLLSEAGYRDANGDGVLEDAEGEPFRFTLLYYQGSEALQSLALMLRDTYARAGINMQLEPAEASVWSEKIDNRDFDAVVMAWSGGDIERDPYQVFHSSSADGGSNYFSYRSAEFDSAIEQARTEINEETRMPIWRQAERILSNDQPYTFLLRSRSLVFVDQRFENVEVNGVGLNLVQIPIETYVPSPMQRYSR